MDKLYLVYQAWATLFTIDPYTGECVPLMVDTYEWAEDRRQDFRDECERVEVERSFSLAKRKCGLGLVTARLRETSAHVVAMSILVLNLRRIQHALLRFLFNFFFRFFPNRKLVFVQ